MREQPETMTQPAPTQRSARQAPEEFTCPITNAIMDDPVIDKEGYTYERVAIEQWLGQNAHSPFTRSPMAQADLVPNRALKSAIRSFQAQQANRSAPPVPTPSVPQATQPIVFVMAHTPTRPRAPNRCARRSCPCESWNGAKGEFCCFACRGGKPCTQPFHAANKPAAPVATPSPFVGARMPPRNPNSG